MPLLTSMPGMPSWRVSRGNRLPMNISHVYNSNYDGIYGIYQYGFNVGSKFHLNLQEMLVGVNSSALSNQGYRYIHYDSDGTRSYFKEQVVDGVTKIAHEFNPNLVLTTSGSTQIISDLQGNKKHFNGGNLVQIEDNNGNIQTITWTSNRISKVTDPAGRIATFGYDSSNRLASIMDPAGRSTTYAYNSSGQLTSITYPDGKITSFQYSSSNLTRVTAHDNSYITFSYVTTSACGQRISYVYQYSKVSSLVDYLQFQYFLNNASGKATGNTTVTNKNGNKVTYLFDSAGRVVNSRNQDNQTHDGQTQFSVYSESQQLKNNSELQTISNNLLKNHGFEQNADWTHWRSGSVGSIAYSTAAKKYGQRSIQVQGDAACFNAAGQTIAGTAGQTYTLSADAYLPSGLNTTNGAWIGFLYEVSGGSWVYSTSEFITSTNGWQRFTHTATLPSNATGVCHVYLAMQYATGTVYFDNVQLEKSGGARYYNLVENSNFSNAPGATSLPTGTTPVKTNTEAGDGVQIQNGRKYVLMTGNPTKAKKISQTVPVYAQAGETLIVGGMAAAYAAGSFNDSRRFAIVADIYFTTGGLMKSLVIPFDRSIAQEHQMAAFYYLLPSACGNVTFSFVYENQIGNVSFDDAFIYVGNYGTEYTYKTNGLLEKLNNNIGGSVVIAYNTNKDISTITQKYNGITTGSAALTYDIKHNVLTSTDIDNVVTTYTYTSAGQVSSVTTSKSTLKSTETMTYTPDGNYLASFTDARGGISSYTYNTTKGLTLTATDPKGNTITYTYNNLTDELLTTTGKANPTTPVTTSFTTQNYLLATINRNSMNYAYEYDNQNRVSTAKVGTTTLMTNTYDIRQRLSKQTFANGAYCEPVYDSRDRHTGDKWNGTQISEYNYNENDRLSQVKDMTTGVTEQYSFDFSGRLESVAGSDGTKTKIGYDAKSAPNLLTFSKNNATIFDASYVTNNQGRVTGSTLHSLGGAALSYTYDDLDRLSNRTMNLTAGALTKLQVLLTYLPGTNGSTTGLVSRYDNRYTDNGTLYTQYLDYTYDANGNIATIKEGSAGTLKATYTYDGLNRLIREDNAWWSCVYNYDAGGNLTVVTYHDYAAYPAALGPATTTSTYTYGNGNWKDQLTSFSGKAITYDALGNPLTYDGRTYTWTKGRQLASISGLADYTYDAQGRRIKKVIGGVTTNYTYSGNLLMRQSDGINTLDFQYDASGTALGFKHNGSNYYYQRNLQGDVIRIRDDANNIVAIYSYDAWGNTGKSGTMADINPIRYRGYYQDNETNYYFLQSRYYSPQWRRFLNADCLFIAGDALTAANMYAYCDNNPVMLCDPSGMDAYDILPSNFPIMVRGITDVFLIGMTIYQEDHGSNYIDGQWAVATIMYNIYHDKTHNDYKNWNAWEKVRADFDSLKARFFVEAVLEPGKFLNAMELAAKLVFPEIFGAFTKYAFPGGGFYTQNRESEYFRKYYDANSGWLRGPNGDVIQVHAYVYVGANAFFIRKEDV